MKEKNKKTKNKRLWKQQIIEENNGNQKLVQKINKIDKTLAKLKERERETQIAIIRTERGILLQNQQTLRW